MVAKNNDGIDYNDVRKFAKALKVNVVGKKKAEAVEMVLDAIVADYEEKQGELSKDDFREYKKTNSEILNWYNKNKEWEPPEEEMAPEEAEKAKAEADAAEEAVTKDAVEEGPELDLSETKDRVKKEKAEVGKRKVEKDVKEKGTDGLYRKDSKYNFVYTLLKKGHFTIDDLLKRYTKEYGKDDTGGTKGNIGIYISYINKKITGLKFKLIKDDKNKFHIS